MKKVKKQNINESNLDIVFLLDRSGSMEDCVEDTIGGYNSYLNRQRKEKNNPLITTILFDDKYEVLHKNKPIQQVKNITKKEYYTRGCTALLDALGKAIKTMENKNAKKVLFVITTDGLENASKEYNKSQIKEMIESHKNWEFIYIGANIDSYAEASQLGISNKNIANYSKSKKGIGKLFDSISNATKMMCLYNEIEDESWKHSLDTYIEKNKE